MPLEMECGEVVWGFGFKGCQIWSISCPAAIPNLKWLSSFLISVVLGLLVERQGQKKELQVFTRDEGIKHTANQPS